MAPSNPFHAEGRPLPNAVPAAFERFYRQTLRRVIGARVRSSTVWHAYSAWATAEGAESVSYHQLRRYMRALGHARRKSNGIQYLDVALAIDAPDVADTFRVLPIEAQAPGAVDDTIAAVDLAVAALGRVRRLLAGEGQ